MVLTEFPFLQPWWSFRWRKWGGGVASLLLGFFVSWRWCRSSWFVCSGIGRGIVEGSSNVGIGWDVKVCILGVSWPLWVVECVDVCSVSVELCNDLACC